MEGNIFRPSTASKEDKYCSIKAVKTSGENLASIIDITEKKMLPNPSEEQISILISKLHKNNKLSKYPPAIHQYEKKIHINEGVSRLTALKNIVKKNKYITYIMYKLVYPTIKDQEPICDINIIDIIPSWKWDNTKYVPKHHITEYLLTIIKQYQTNK